MGEGGNKNSFFSFIFPPTSAPKPVTNNKYVNKNIFLIYIVFFIGWFGGEGWCQKKMNRKKESKENERRPKENR